jgi:CYTH domain-containing protein
MHGTMTVQEVKPFVGQWVEVSYVDRSGHEVQAEGFLYEVDYRPMYGAVMVLDELELSLEKVRNVVSRKSSKAA